MLNNNQLNIKIVLALKPIEETTKIISTSLACISAVIPLIKIKKTINKHNDDAGINDNQNIKLTSTPI